MTKHLLKFFMAVIASLYAANSFAYDFQVNGIYYNVIDVSALTCGVSGISEEESGDIITLPSTVSYSGKDLKVTSILEDAFKESHVKNITLPSSLQTIARYAFCRCTDLESISIPEGVSSIGKSAFDGCSSLKFVVIPKSILQIDEYAFTRCDNIETVTIEDLNSWCNIKFESGWCYIVSDTYTSNPLSNMNAKLILDGEEIDVLDTRKYNISKINNGAFVGYCGLKSVILCDETSSIGNYCFWNCKNLASLTIGSSINQIPQLAFGECTNLSELYIADCDTELQFNGGLRGDGYNGVYKNCFGGDFRDSNLKTVYIGRNLSRQTNDSRFQYYAIFEKQDIDSLCIGSMVTRLTKSYFNGDRVNGDYVGKIKNINTFNIQQSKGGLICVFESENYGTLSNGPLMMINPQTLILGRNLTPAYIYDYINFNYVKTFFDQSKDMTRFDIGENVSDISYLNLSNNADLSTIQVRATVPPTCTAQEFPNNVYMHCNVTVPLGNEDAYKESPIWGKFWNLEGSADLSTITPTIVDNTTKVTSYYLLNGTRLYAEPQKGIYIRKQGSSVTKVIK